MKTDFAETIIEKLDNVSMKDSKTYSSSSPIDVGTAIADGITDYITNKVKVLVAWSGSNPTSGAPDPIISDTIPIVGKCAPIVFSSDFDSWVKTIEANVIAGFFFGVGDAGVTPTGTIPSFTAGLDILQSDLKSAADSNEDAPQNPFWEAVCEKIIEWLETCTTSTYPGVHAAFVGAATWTKTNAK